MNAATEFDVGPLTWVKSEIDLALERADQALQEYAAGAASGAGDLTRIKFCRTHLHQVQGALTIVGLDGVTQFAESLEALLEAIELEKRPADEPCIALAQRSLAVIRHYLDELIGGQPNQPLRLFSHYREIQAARGIAKVVATDLFYPDLSVRPPRRQNPAKRMDHADFQRMLRQERARFQRGLLAWLRSPQDRSGVAEMLGAVKRIESSQDAASARSFWWVSAGFLSALAEGTLPAETDVKQLCARIDLQIRRLFEGSKNVAERLMRDALYFVANADSSNSSVQQVKETYHLAAAIPAEETNAPAPQESTLRKLRDVITATEEAWNKYCAGTTQVLPVFRENAQALSGVVEQLGHTDYRRLAQAVAAAANWLTESPARHSEALAMEVATAILLAQNAQGNFQRLGSSFAHQVDVMVARIHGCISGTPPQPDSEIPLLDEMSRQAQEKLLVGQVAKEIQSNLAQIEQVLDAFFRDNEKRGDLVNLDVPLRQISGALTMMRHDGAVAALRECSAGISRFSLPDYVPQQADFERVASQLSMVGFFIEAMQHGAGDFDAFVSQMQSKQSGSGADGAGEEDEPEGTVEQEVEQQRREASALLEAYKEQPRDAGLREELKQNLSVLQEGASLVADEALGQQTRSMLSALESGDAGAPQIEEALATFKAPQAEVPQPSAETLQLSQASSEEIDAELLSIFLEEAHEVMGTINDNLRLLKEQPHNVEVLTTIRRSFHTLKGSGRMVGLRDLGEAAWSIEQVLNLWLRTELEVNPPLFEMLDEALAVFSAWVAHLESRDGMTPDPAHLIAVAESLRQVSEDAQPLTIAESVRPELSEVPALQEQTETILELESPAETGFEDLSGLVADFEIEPLPDVPLEPETPVQGYGVLSESLSVLDEPSAVSAMPDFSDISLELADDSPTGGEREEISFEALPDAGEDGLALDVLLPAEPPRDTGAPTHQRMSISPALYEIFAEEARTHLATLHRELPALEQDEVAQTPHEMYRAAHTLAGIAATVGLRPVNQLGLALEHALLRRDNSASPGSLEALGVVRQTIAELDLMLLMLADQYEPVLPPGLVDTLDSLYPAQIVASHDPVPAAEVESAEVETPADEIPLAGAAVVSEGALPEFSRPAAPAMSMPQVRDEIDEQLLPIFLEEAVELSESIAIQLRSWRNAPANTEAVRTLSRLMHTLKGSARMAGVMTLGELTHVLESRIEDINRTGGANDEVIDEIESAFDLVQQIIDRLQRGESLDQLSSPQAPEPAASNEITSVTAPDGEVPTGAPAAVSAAATPETSAPAKDGDRRRGRRSFDEAEAESDASAQRATLRVRADLIDRLVNEAGELSIARARIEGEMRSLKESLLDLTENVIRLRRHLRDIEIQAETQMQSRIAQTDEHRADFDPLEFDRFTRFQELTRMMAESVNDVATVQQNLLKNLDDANAAIIAQARLNREVQQELMGVRMVPFGSVADRLYRIVRQTSKDLGKRANLEISGSQVELDRSVLDKMGAPLEHMLRNAIAHGLEDRETRIARGKQDIGEISLSLKQEGNEIILSFADDGAGLNFDRIRERGVEAGLIETDEVVDTAGLADLIFTPGFSTASEISQIAGRGVGMDVVKTEVAALGGRIEVFSTPGQGTEFRLYIPLTLAVTKALLVRAGHRRYAVPSVMIEQVLDVKDSELTKIRDAGVAEWMGNSYPFNYLPHLLGETEALPEQHRQYWILLLRSGTRRISVLVDELAGNEEIVVKNIGPQLARVIGVDGATVLGDGQVVLILNPVALSTRAPVAEFVSPVPTAVLPTSDEGEIATLPTVMVVDDSLTVRKITSRLLARDGYQVLLAKDGVEALEMLLDVVPDVMLVDIEMPRMDGFDLTRNVRADARLKKVPIIMITSRTADKHRNYAFEIGVNQYLGKPYQEEELLAYVADYVRQQRQNQNA